VNGETDPAKIAKLELMQGLDAPASKAAAPRKAAAKEASPKEPAEH
jgi:hypothetical protein